MRKAMFFFLFATLCGCGGGGGGSEVASVVPTEPAPVASEFRGCPEFYTHEVPAYADTRDPSSRYVWTWTAFYDADCNIIRVKS